MIVSSYRGMISTPASVTDWFALLCDRAFDPASHTQSVRNLGEQWLWGTEIRPRAFCMLNACSTTQLCAYSYSFISPLTGKNVYMPENVVINLKAFSELMFLDIMLSII